MEEIEITSWLTLDAIKKKAKVVEVVGSLQVGHSMSVFCFIEDDYLELFYSDSAANALRRYEDREEFDLALEERKEEGGETPFDEDDHTYAEDEDDDDGEDREADDEAEFF
ncbi:MAG: hypothetical protein JXE07_05450 [Candidatus Aminicenantes bacterium]|nr:hypothetical protein [Candidatus Aminicenantes bacterium]